MRRSLSVGAVGVVLASGALAAANATNEAPETPADHGAVISAPLLKAFAVTGEGKVGTWGVPVYVVAPEKPVESTPVIEEVAEEVPAVQEAPAEETAVAQEVAPVEEAPVAEEAPAQEAPVEVATEEAAPVEEAAAQEAAPVEEAPVAEEAPAQEAPVEVAPAADTVEVIEEAPAAQEGKAPAEEAKPAASQVPAAAAEPTLSTASNSAKRDAVVAAAKGFAAVNAQTDCTALATNSLKVAGINFHGWPTDYMSLGSITSNPQPGDLVIYTSNGYGQQHIAVYIGNGQAVHGGWGGQGTTIFSVNLPAASAPIYVSPAAYNN